MSAGGDHSRERSGTRFGKDGAMTERRDDAEPIDADLADAELSGFRARLLSERRALQAERDEAMAELGKLREAGDDSADAEFLRDQQQAITASRRTLLAQTEHALQRIDTGAYGRCERCGRSIPKSRLSMLPMATLDGRCASVGSGERE